MDLPGSHINVGKSILFSSHALTTEEAIEIVDVFLTTDFEGGRHERRVNKINK